MPIMAEGRDLRNKVVFIDDNAYAVGGLNSKAEKFNYPIADNLDSWACALIFNPKDYPFKISGASTVSRVIAPVVNN